ncbi:MAG: hypothetical protein LBF93_04820 [Zoogloeaceae bacterium]|nr:hypothetical protein [Zoogloeaceae bacterium]
MGCRLPASHIESVRLYNVVGTPRKHCFPTEASTDWAKDHIAITAISGVDPAKPYSLTGETGDRPIKEGMGYPDIGICIANTPTRGIRW